MDVHKKLGERLKRKRLIWFYSVRHPSVPLLYYSGMLYVIFLFKSPVFMAGAFILSIVHTVYMTSAREMTSYIKGFVPLAIVIALINPLLVHRGAHVLFYLFDKQITLEASVYGICISLMMLSMLLCFFNINKGIDSGRLLYLLAGVIPQTAFILSMTIRNFTVFKEKIHEYAGVQKARDNIKNEKESGLETSKFKQRISEVKQAGMLLGGFSAWMLEGGMDTAQSLRAKGYGNKKRTTYAKYEFEKADGASFAIFILIIFILTALRITGAGMINFYKTDRLFTINAADCEAFFILTIYFLLPIIGEMIFKERNSKTYEASRV